MIKNRGKKLTTTTTTKFSFEISMRSVTILTISHLKYSHGYVWEDSFYSLHTGKEKPKRQIENYLDFQKVKFIYFMLFKLDSSIFLSHSMKPSVIRSTKH